MLVGKTTDRSATIRSFPPYRKGTLTVSIRPKARAFLNLSPIFPSTANSGSTRIFATADTIAITRTGHTIGKHGGFVPGAALAAIGQFKRPNCLAGCDFGDVRGTHYDRNVRPLPWTDARRRPRAPRRCVEKVDRGSGCRGFKSLHPASRGRRMFRSMPNGRAEACVTGEKRG